MESNPNPNPPQPESYTHTHIYNNGTHTHTHTHTHTYTYIYNNGPQPANVEAVPEQPVDQAAIDENERRVRFHRPLYDAASSGNWGKAERFLNRRPPPGFVVDIKLPKLNGMTVLHVAATMGHARFITSLLNYHYHPGTTCPRQFPRDAINTTCRFQFPRGAMKDRDKFGWSALHYAASYGHLSVVEVLFDADNSLILVLDDDHKNTPLRQAANNAANGRVLRYLVEKTPDGDPSLFEVKGAQLINALAVAGYYDICLKLLRPPSANQDTEIANRYIDLANNLLTPELDLITSLVRSPDLFPSGSRHIFRKGWIYRLPILNRIREVEYKQRRIKELLDVTCRAMSTWKTKDFVKYFETYTDDRGSILRESAKNGVTETISAFIKHAPDYMDEYSPNVDIILWSIEHRREHVFNFMMERDVFVKLLPEYANDEERETYLHAAAKLAPYARLTSVSSPALQMQRELQWFRGVEKFVRPIMKTYVNKNGQTPRELFTTAHEDLAEKAEKWMKDTANSCLVVAALIITVVFAAAFTIPGGLDDKGIASFLKRNDFMVFVISDAAGMFSAATSIFMFLSILTARYAVDDFLYALPNRLILGLVFLLIAIVSMMVAFGAALYIILYPRYKCFVIFLIIGITSIPVVSFFILQLSLIWAMVISTLGPSILKPMKTPW